MTDEQVHMARAGLWVYGDNAAPPIVLVHGIRVSASMWTPHARRLAPDFRVSAVDLPGHGTLREHTFTLAAAVRQLDDAVAEAARATGRRPLVLGMSLGGYVALAHAVRGPHSVQALVLCGSTARPRGWKALAYSTAARVNDLLGPERSAARDERLFRRHTTKECADAILAGDLAMRAFGEAVRELRQIDFLALTACLTHPVLFVNGRVDFVFRPDERIFLNTARRAGVPAKLIHAPGGHLFPLQDPQSFVQLVKRAHRELTGNW
ncbi:alpha/beta fold hydrolase [Streptomyces sp. NPDC020792]|uniref:alpha/beta fold hydrolase n=1 Tax=Streptomyces sp. NPDC020792 TaxID=3365089 RepID=UPI0037AE7426